MGLVARINDSDAQRVDKPVVKLHGGTTAHALANRRAQIEKTLASPFDAMMGNKSDLEIVKAINLNTAALLLLVDTLNAR